MCLIESPSKQETYTNPCSEFLLSSEFGLLWSGDAWYMVLTQSLLHRTWKHNSLSRRARRDLFNVSIPYTSSSPLIPQPWKDIGGIINPIAQA